MNQYEYGATMAVADLQKQGWNVKYERIPGVGLTVAPTEAAFLAAQAKNPDVWLGLTAPVLFALGPKVKASGIPTFAFSSPPEGVKSGPQGGDNIFLTRPLNDQFAQKMADYACNTMKMKKIGVLAANLPFGTLGDQVFREAAKKYKGCNVVDTEVTSISASDVTQQVLAFKNAGVDGVVAFSYPIPVSGFVQQSVQNGLDVPFLGTSTLGLAADNNPALSTKNLAVMDVCVPQGIKTKVAKKFTKAYEAKYDAPPDYAAASAYDAIMMAANAVAKVGHDHPALVKEIATTQHDGICPFRADKNNVLDQNLYVYTYNPDRSHKLVKTYPLEYLAPDEIAGVTTTVAAPTTTVAPR